MSCATAMPSPSSCSTGTERLHLFDTKELRTIVYAQHSLMPHNFDKVSAADQYRDLVAMLAVQARTKVQRSAAGRKRGRPMISKESTGRLIARSSHAYGHSVDASQPLARR